MFTNEYDRKAIGELRAMARVYSVRGFWAKAEQLLALADAMERRAKSASSVGSPSDSVVELDEFRNRNATIGGEAP